MFQYLPDFFQNESSEDNMYLAQRVMFQIDEMLSHDMLNEYYHLPRKYMKLFMKCLTRILNVWMQVMLMAR